MRRSATWAFPLAALLLASNDACGIFAMQKDQDELVAKETALEKKSTTDLGALRADLDATRERLDNALRANADNGSDLMSEKQRINQLVGRIDEVAHTIEELRSTVTSMRTELDARIDEMKRAQAVQQPPPPPPVVIPADKAQHYAAFMAATKVKDWGLARTLGHEYVNRYATDEKADEVVYTMGDGDLSDGQPSSALGEFNRVLKQYPKSKFLDRTLFDMGVAYFAMHDCANAKLAFQACEAHFGREKIAAEAKRRIADIDHAAPGTCAPSP
jgi:TolA-binding protein